MEMEIAKATQYRTVPCVLNQKNINIIISIIINISSSSNINGENGDGGRDKSEWCRSLCQAICLIGNGEVIRYCFIESEWKRTTCLKKTITVIVKEFRGERDEDREGDRSAH